MFGFTKTRFRSAAPGRSRLTPRCCVASLSCSLHGCGAEAQRVAVDVPDSAAPLSTFNFELSTAFSTASLSETVAGSRFGLSYRQKRRKRFSIRNKIGNPPNSGFCSAAKVWADLRRAQLGFRGLVLPQETNVQPTRTRPPSAIRAYALRNTTRTGGRIGTCSTALNCSGKSSGRSSITATPP